MSTNQYDSSKLSEADKRTITLLKGRLVRHYAKTASDCLTRASALCRAVGAMNKAAKNGGKPQLEIVK